MKNIMEIKHDTAENWAKAVNFIPKNGEMVIYDGVVKDGNYVVKPKIKLGDGITKINDLPFMIGQEKDIKIYNNGDSLVISGLG